MLDKETMPLQPESTESPINATMSITTPSVEPVGNITTNKGIKQLNSRRSVDSSALLTVVDRNLRKKTTTSAK